VLQKDSLGGEGFVASLVACEGLDVGCVSVSHFFWKVFLDYMLYARQLQVKRLCGNLEIMWIFEFNRSI
jgi:hypothetical protein